MQIPIFKDAAAGSDKPVRIAHVFNSAFTLNEPTDDPYNTYLIETSLVDVSWDQTVEPYAERDGMQAGRPRRAQVIYRLGGYIKALTLAGLYDKISAFEEAFDPVNTWFVDNASTFDRGFLPYAFDVPTADTANYATGLIPVRIYVQATKKIVPIQTTADGFQMRFDLLLRAVDPRVYSQTTSLEERTGNGTVTLDNTLATYHSWPVVKLAFTTAPSSEITIVRTTPTMSEAEADRKVKLDNTLLAGSQELVLDFQAQTAVYVSGANKIAAVKPDSSWFVVHPESNVLTFAGLPSDCAVDVEWVRAFV